MIRVSLNFNFTATCPSAVKATSCVFLPNIFTLIFLLDGKTRGRWVKVWGQMAVTIKASTLGVTMGPPADKE